MKDTFRALAGRDFRFYFVGQVVSLVGTWVQQVAMAWITYQVTGSAFMLGVIAFCGQVPTLILSPIGGMLADRMQRRNVLLLTQVVAMAVAAWLALVAYTHTFTPWVLVVAAVLMGVTGGIEMPTRQAFLLEIVHDRSHGPNAIALNSLTFNGARLVGPAVSGAILAWIGDTACFVINALSFLAAIYTLLVIHPKTVQRHGPSGALLGGVYYLRDFAPARWVLITVGSISLCIAPFMTFMPVYAKDIFSGGADTLGILMGTSGFGAVIASLYLATRKSLAGSDARIAGGCFATGLASVAFAYNPYFSLALPLLVLSGGATIIVITSCNILLQHLVPENLRGRVMALYTMSFIGMLPVGSLLAGSLSDLVGVKPVFVASGLVGIAISYVLRRRLPDLRKQASPVLAEQSVSPH